MQAIHSASSNQLALFGADVAVPADAERGPDQPIALRERATAALGTQLEDGLHFDQVGVIYQRRLEAEGTRRTTGSFYTPSDVVSGLLSLTLAPILDRREPEGLEAVAALRILDPACGTGNFIIAAATAIRDSLIRLGMNISEASRIAFGECVRGVDIDHAATDICRYLIAREADFAISDTEARRAVLHADSLLTPLASTDPRQQGLLAELGAPDGFDLVIGNPPFLNQLGADTRYSKDYTDQLAHRFGAASKALSNPAALFLAMAVEAARPDGGTACLVEPLPLLTTRDATNVRQRVLENARLSGLWIADRPVFDVPVNVCAPILVRGLDAEAGTAVYSGHEMTCEFFAPEPSPNSPTWSDLLAQKLGVPTRPLKSVGVVGDIADATADFREQYYGIAGAVVDCEDGDDDAFPPLVTAGLIDPATLLWGAQLTSFNKRRFLHPRVDRGALPPHLQEWATSRLVPKLLLATQTKVLEVVVDMDGRLLPSVPVITITAKPDDLWSLAALLSSPAVTMVAATRHAGAALSPDALKLSATQVMTLPLPADYDALRCAGQAFRDASTAPEHTRGEQLLRAARLTNLAFGLGEDDEVTAWWDARLPRKRRSA